MIERKLQELDVKIRITEKKRRMLDQVATVIEGYTNIDVEVDK